MTSSTPCTACSWTPERQSHCSYKSHVNLFYECSDRGVWSLGSKLILKVRGPRRPTLEAPNIQFVQNHTSIPVPTVIDAWNEESNTLIVMTRIPGDPLSKVWSSLSSDEKENIARQTAEYLQQLRNLQSDKIQALEGRPVYSNFLFMTRSASFYPQGPFGSDDELWAMMERGLADNVPEAVRRRLRRRMPSATPYTFTHGDLTNVNIMVENGVVTGIIDWELSGYLPVWWEYVNTSITDSEEDREWKILLRKYLPEQSAAREFYLDYSCLCRDLSSERAVKFIEETVGEEA